MNPHLPHRFPVTSTRWGFTMVELLVVIAVVALLAALLLPAVNSSLARARQMQSLSNMKTITSGLLAFASDNTMRIPSMNGIPAPPTWDAQILPYLGFRYSATYAGGTVTDGTPLSLLAIFRCPLDTRKPAPGLFPRSYGVSGVAINPVGLPPPQPPPWSGGKPNRPVGEGIGLLEVRRPASFVLLCRLPIEWELPGVVVGEGAMTAYNGPNPNDATDHNWRIFGGKTPYGFLDGHVGFFTPAQAVAVDPATWTYDK